MGEYQDLFDKHKTALVSLLSFSNFFGRVLFGFISDFASAKLNIVIYFWLPVLTTIMAGIQLLPYYFNTVSALYYTTIALGLTYGASFACWPLVLNKRFGDANYSLNWGFLTSGCGIFGTIMVAVFGNVYDKASSTNDEGLTTCYDKTCYQNAFVVTVSYLIIFGMSAANIAYMRLKTPTKN